MAKPKHKKDNSQVMPVFVHDTGVTSQMELLSADVFGSLFRGPNAVPAIDMGLWDDMFEEAFSAPKADGVTNPGRAKLRAVTNQAELESAEEKSGTKVSSSGHRMSAKYKIDRRMGENIWGRPKSPVNHREYGPGQHGQRRKGKLSDFGLQLRAKQKLKGYYGDLTEKQFREILSEAERIEGDATVNLVTLLEQRLDAVVFRAKFVPTIFAARKIVNQGHVRVNGKRVNIPSYRVKAGDVIDIRSGSKHSGVVRAAAAQSDRNVPDYIEADYKTMTATFKRAPSSLDVPSRVTTELNPVVGFYGKTIRDDR